MMSAENKKLINPGKWYAIFSEKGEIAEAVYDRSCYRLLGFDSEEEAPFHLKSWEGQVHPEDIAELKSSLKEVLSPHLEGMDLDTELRLKTRWGFRRFHVFAHFIRRDDGSPVRCDGVFFDIQDTEDMKANYGQSVSIANYFVDSASTAYYCSLTDKTVKILQNADRQKTSAREKLLSYDDSILPYVKEYIHPEDRQQVLDCIEPGTVRERLRTAESYTFLFREVIEKIESVYRGIVMRGEDEDHAVLIFWNITGDLQQEQEQKEFDPTHRLLIENNARVLALAENFEFLYDVELQTDRYELYSRGSSFPDELAFLRKKNQSFFEGIRKQTEAIVYPEDREDFNRMITKEYIVRTLEENKSFNRYFRFLYEGRPTWFKIRILYKNDDKQNLIIGIFNAEEEMLSKLASEQSRKEFITRMAGCESLYIVDSETGSVKILLQNEYLSEKYGTDTNYNVSIARYVETDVYAPDRKAAAESLSLFVTRRQLETASEYTVQYRDITSGVPLWYEMRAVKLSDSEILFGFANKNREIITDRCKDSIYDDQYALFSVDMDSEILTVLKRSPWDTAYEDGDMLPYSEVMKRIANRLGGEAKKFYTEQSDIRYLRQELTKEDKRIFSYPSSFVEDGKWVTLTIYVIARHENGLPSSCALCFSLLDTLGVGREEMQTQLQQDMEIIGGLASEYLALYYINLSDNTFRVYSVDGTRLKDTKQLLAGNNDPFTLIHRFVQSAAVHPDDRHLFADLTRENVLKKFDGHKKFSICFRRNFGQGYLWSIMDVIKYEAINETANVIIVGFAERDKEIRQEQEQAVARDLARQQIALKSFGDMINAGLWRVDIRGRDELSSIVWSEEFRHMFGFENEEDFPNVLESWSDRLHPEDREPTLIRFWDGVRSETEGLVYNVNYRIKRKTGEYCWYHSVGRIEDNGDGTRRLYGIIIDISADKRLEEQQVQLQEALAMAQSANRAKTTFLNNMSHDIRTPMNAIIGYTGLAKTHIDNREQVENYLGKISQSSDHLLSLINDVLDMSRIESGKMYLEKKEENLSSIIHTLRDIVQADVHAKQLDFYIDAVDVRDEDIVCDKLRLNQVLLNILSNAIKYTGAGGSVTMYVREKNVKPNGYATYEFCIKDTGMGMSEDFLKTIYDPFTRVKSSMVSGIQGTGLGMAITRNIVDMMGGTIGIRSELDKGTEVTVTFTFKLQSSPKTAVVIPELSGIRSLIVDDDMEICMSISKMVKEIGMRADWCASGKEAVVRTEEASRYGDPFMIYIIDLMMPNMNGIETTRKIRRTVGPDAPILILTSYDWADIESEAKEAGVTAFVSKPMFPSDLHRVLDVCISKIPDSDEQEVQDYDFRGKKLLLVEDNELNQEIATELLKENGFLIDVAEDGDIAVEKIRNAGPGDYDLILMDIQMPRMDGYEATRQIRALATDYASIPIIAMTANAFEEDRKAALDSGMNEHISKPIDIEKLKAMLARFL